MCMKRAIWLMLVGFLTLLTLALVLPGIWGVLRGKPPMWRHYYADGHTFWEFGMGLSYMYAAKIDRPRDTAYTPGEVGVVSMGHELYERTFYFASWSHDFRDAFYSKDPAELKVAPEDLDARLHLYRRTIEMDKKLLVLNTWRCASATAAIPMIALLVAVFRYIRRRRIFVLDHCRVCGYDLRATPLRCPECGTAAMPRGATT